MRAGAQIDRCLEGAWRPPSYASPGHAHHGYSHPPWRIGPSLGLRPPRTSDAVGGWGVYVTAMLVIFR
jgi:hypothetical protein